MTRREAIYLLPLLGAAASAGGEAGNKAATLTASRVFSLPTLKVVQQQGGWETRPVLHGNLLDGEALDIHHSVLPAGQMPHPPHRHKHAELMVLLEGKVDFYNNSETQRMESSDIVFAAPNQLHGWKNVGDGPARYYVIAIGTDTP